LTPTITASEARDVARRWVEDVGSRTPSFVGAVLHGSINWLGPNDVVLATSDIDLMLILDCGPAQPTDKLGKLRYRDVLLDVSSLTEDELRTPEAILGQYHLAGSFAGRSVIADPTGRLTALENAVTRDYARRRWVRERCAHALAKVRNAPAVCSSDDLADQVMGCLFPAAVCTHVLLVAGLRNPTVRNRYLPTRSLLAEYGRSDLYDTLLTLQGCADVTADCVRQHFAALVVAFDAAKEAPKPPFPFAADISDAGRPVAIDGSRELIEGGNPREAVFWIAVTYSRCMKILGQDRTPDAIEGGYLRLLGDLGLATFADRQRRRQHIAAALPQVWDAAEAIMEQNPNITD